jgi:SpoVK/Ycf46/Vps4 family AAA+-type ATPase
MSSIKNIYRVMLIACCPFYADVLFGKRSNMQNAHHRYANQEVSYLLQRVEDFPGLIILTSNFKGNIDSALVRRFNSIIHFLIPNKEERYAIWKSSVSPQAVLAKDIDLSSIAGKYEFSGSSLVSVIHYASLQTISRNTEEISRTDILEALRENTKKKKEYLHKSSLIVDSKNFNFIMLIEYGYF